MTQNTEPLPDGLLAEIRRCREMVEHARKLGPNCGFYVATVSHDIRDAEAALASGDAIAMMRAITALREVH